MGKKKKYIKNKSVMLAIVLATTIFTSACVSTQKTTNEVSQTTNSAATETTESMETTEGQVVDISAYAIEYSTRDTNTDWQNESQTLITATDGQVNLEGNGATVDGETITISSEGTYVLSGTFDEHHIIVDAPDQKIRIVCNGVNLTSANEAPIQIQNSKKVVITIADETTNTINDNRETDIDAVDSDTEGTTTNPTAAIYSKEDITFQGNGMLTVNSTNNNGITSKDGLIFMGGTMEVNASGAGITGKDYVVIADGEYVITSGKDAIRATNDVDENMGFVKIEGGTVNILSDQDGISAVTLAYVSEGTITMAAGGGAVNGATHSDDFRRGPQESTTETEEEETTSMKGIKAGTLVYINGGNINIDAADDTLHSNGDVIVQAGTLQLSSGEDGIHADNLLEIYQGKIDIVQSYEGLEGTNINIYDGDIDITASDDGINVYGGSDQFGGGPWGNMPPDGTMPEGDKGMTPPDQTMSEQDKDMAPPDQTMSESPIEQSNDNETESEIERILTISGGKIHVNAQGDGLDSNGSIVQTGGEVIVDGPTNGGNGAIDYDTSYTMTGGTLLAIGSSGMWQTIGDESTVYCMTVFYTDNQEAQSEIVVAASDKEVMTYQSQKSFDAITYASASIKNGDEVSIQSGTEVKTATVTEINTQVKTDNSVITGAITDSMGGNMHGGMGKPQGERKDKKLNNENSELQYKNESN